MTERWVSHGHHWCEYCKTFIAATKISMEQHERGSRHRMNVQQFLKNQRKKKTQEEKEQTALNRELQRIERAAQQAVARDRLSDQQMNVPLPPSSVATAPSVPPFMGMQFSRSLTVHSAGPTMTPPFSNYHPYQFSPTQPVPIQPPGPDEDVQDLQRDQVETATVVEATKEDSAAGTIGAWTCVRVIRRDVEQEEPTVSKDSNDIQVGDESVVHSTKRKRDTAVETEPGDEIPPPPPLAPPPAKSSKIATLPPGLAVKRISTTTTTETATSPPSEAARAIVFNISAPSPSASPIIISSEYCESSRQQKKVQLPKLDNSDDTRTNTTTTTTAAAATSSEITFKSRKRSDSTFRPRRTHPPTFM